jgi:transposase-like protein
LARELRKSSHKYDKILSSMKCDICTEDDGNGIHYHAFIDGKHRWVCESCKKKLKIEAEHVDD